MAISLFGLVFPAQADLTSGLVAHYPFDGNASDMSGNGNHGTVNGATLGTDRHGVAGKAYGFDGVDDYILLNSLSLGTTYSLAAWIRPLEETDSDWFNIMSNNGQPQWGMPDQSLSIQLHARITGSSLLRHQWTQVALVRDGGSHTLYKMGLPDGTLNSIQGNDAYSVIGAYQYASAGLSAREPFNGSIDDVRIYDRALSAVEVAALYQLEAPADPNSDADADGFTYAQETEAGTDPDSNASKPGLDYGLVAF
ncbi:MAG: LamG domain-containing protein, partial [Opitutae bacterium]|nr:LamG domain-containing protein [Opitutae bacterium]